MREWWVVISGVGWRCWKLWVLFLAGSVVRQIKESSAVLMAAKRKIKDLRGDL